MLRFSKRLRDFEQSGKFPWSKFRSDSDGQTGDDTPRIAFVNAFFLVVASVLGTGILGLPVKLAQSGFYPFLASYFLCFIMQVMIMFYMVELLQRGRMINEADVIHAQVFSGSVPLSEFSSSVQTDEELEDILNQQEDTQHSLGLPDLNAILNRSDSNILDLSHQPDDPDQQQPSNPAAALQHLREPNLHSMGKMFLDRYSRLVFDVAVMVHFISILISYSLAGSEAFAQLFGVEHLYLISPFVIILTLVVVFGTVLLQPIISFLTFGKGTILILMVAATAVVGMKVGRPMSTNWEYVGKPFLIGTVALGGAVNLLAVTFAKIHPNRNDTVKYLKAIIGGLFTVWVLNVLWCYYLLRIVPQTPAEGPINLLNSNKKGEISPLSLF